VTSREDIAKRIVELLRETPLLTARQVAAELDLPDVNKSLVNSIMYLDELKRFTKDDSPRPQWSLTSNVVSVNSQDATKDVIQESKPKPEDVTPIYIGMKSVDSENGKKKPWQHGNRLGALGSLKL